MKKFISLALLTALGCASGTASIDPTKVANAGAQITTLYFARQQGVIDTMTDPVAKQKAQAQLIKQETDFNFGIAVTQILTSNLQPTSRPSK